MSGYRVAIDYGTSYSAAAFHDLASGRTEIVKVNDILSSIPSMVVLDEDQLLAGPAADNTYLSASLEHIERTPKAKLADDLPLFRAPLIRPTDAAAATMRILLDAVVTGHNGTPPTEVRLTHPVAWEDARRGRLVEAGRKAGIKSPVLVPEPVAAALHLAAQADVGAGEHVAVYDFGAGTFDTAVLVRTKTGFQPVGMAGGLALGGEDLDEALYEYVVGLLEDVDRDEIARSEEKVWRRARRELRRNVQAAKHSLGTADLPASIAYPGPRDLPNIRVTQEAFRKLVGPRVDETVDELARTVAAAGLTPDRLARVYLAGGSSRIGLVTTRLRERFGEKTATSADRKAVVALGAAAASAEAMARVSVIPAPPTAPPEPEPPEPTRPSRRGTRSPKPAPEPSTGLPFYDDPRWPGVEVTTKALACVTCGSRRWRGVRLLLPGTPPNERPFVQGAMSCELGHHAPPKQLAALERKALEALGLPPAVGTSTSTSTPKPKPKPRASASLLGPVSVAVREGDSIYALAEGARLVRAFKPDATDPATSDVALPSDGQLLAASAKAVVVVAAQKAIVFRPDLKGPREFGIVGDAPIGLVAGATAAWVLSRAGTKTESLSWFGADHARVSALLVTRLPYTSGGSSNTFGVTPEWIVTAAAGTRVPATTFEPYGSDGTSAVALVAAGRSKLFGFDEWQDMVVAPATGAVSNAPIRGRVVHAIHLDKGEVLGATSDGLMLAGSVVEPTVRIGTGVGARASRSTWVLSRHGRLALVEAPAGLRVVAYQKGRKARDVHVEPGARLLPPPYRRANWCDDDDGVWITAQAGDKTRFLQVHPDRGKVAEVERSSYGEPLGSAGGRLFLMIPPPRNTMFGGAIAIRALQSALGWGKVVAIDVA